MATVKPSKKKSGSAKKTAPSPKKGKAIKRAEKKPVKPVKKKALRKKEKPMVKAVKAQQAAPAGKPKNETEAIRKNLLDMRTKLLAGISESPIPQVLAAQSDIGDLVDQAGDERDRELSLLLSGRDKEKVQAINEALEKVEDGSYGTCEECGDRIGPGRLKVMPLAKYCVSCQAKLEKEMSLQRRVDEDLTYRSLTYSSGAEEDEP